MQLVSDAHIVSVAQTGTIANLVDTPPNGVPGRNGPAELNTVILLKDSKNIYYLYVYFNHIILI